MTRLVFLLVCAGAPLASQGARLDSLAARAHRLHAVAEDARRAWDEVRARLDALPRDTVRSGSLTVLVRQGDAPRAERGVSLAAAELERSLGDAVELLAGRPLELQFGAGTSVSGAEIPVIGVPDSVTPEELAATLVGWAGPVLAARGSAALRRWSAVPVNANREGLLRRAYIEVVTADPGAATVCLAGSNDACAIALGLTIPDDPATAYWDPLGRRIVVARSAGRYWQGTARRRASECITAGSDAACVQALRAMFGEGASSPAALAPLGTAPRQALLLLAIETGGDGAIGRLVLDSTAALQSSIEAAAGVPLNAVIERWRSALRRAGGDVELSTASRLTALAWILALAGLAMGGTRWRVG